MNRQRRKLLSVEQIVFRTMDQVLRKRLEERDEHIPTVWHYEDLLYLITDKLDITFEEARNRYGLFTYAQWAKLLEQ